jgi:hypothetical protein
VNEDWLNVPIGAPSSPPQPQPAFPWVQLERWAPWAVVLVIAGAWFISSRRQNDDGEPIMVDGLRVLIVEESANRQSLPPDQSQILTSVPIRELVEKLGGQIRILDADDPTDALAAEWRAIRKRITITPPAVVFAKPRRAMEMALPANVDQFENKLEAFAK